MRLRWGSRPQVSPLRYAPVETTKLWHPPLFLPQEADVRCLTTLSSRPERSVVEGPAVPFPPLQGSLEDKPPSQLYCPAATVRCQIPKIRVPQRKA
jgi:hypothetical protein